MPFILTPLRRLNPFTQASHRQTTHMPLTESSRTNVTANINGEQVDEGGPSEISPSEGPMTSSRDSTHTDSNTSDPDVENRCNALFDEEYQRLLFSAARVCHQEPEADDQSEGRLSAPSHLRTRSDTGTNAAEEFLECVFGDGRDYRNNSRSRSPSSPEFPFSRIQRSESPTTDTVYVPPNIQNIQSIKHLDIDGRLSHLDVKTGSESFEAQLAAMRERVDALREENARLTIENEQLRAGEPECMPSDRGEDVSRVNFGDEEIDTPNVVDHGTAGSVADVDETENHDFQEGCEINVRKRKREEREHRRTGVGTEELREDDPDDGYSAGNAMDTGEGYTPYRGGFDCDGDANGPVDVTGDDTDEDTEIAGATRTALASLHAEHENALARINTARSRALELHRHLQSAMWFSRRAVKEFNSAMKEAETASSWLTDLRDGLGNGAFVEDLVDE
ncbi:hypothetical protein HDU93_003751 [Gonapodya sp. JEL0774]|nr:hypothetical protein HDU93_003751 [Gonapodya sp. JEL0774]